MANWFPYHNGPLDILERHLHRLDAAQATWVPPGGRKSIGWKPGFPPTLFWVFHHVFEHEMYHVGQISLLLRLAGLGPLPF